MSKIHAFENFAGNVQVVLHTAMPAGSNSVGVSWKNAAINSGIQGTTVMVEGTGAGQIATAEKTSVLAGDVIEISGKTIPYASGGGGLPSVNEMADLLINEYKADLQLKLQYFGFKTG